MNGASLKIAAALLLLIVAPFTHATDKAKRRGPHLTVTRFAREVGYYCSEVVRTSGDVARWEKLHRSASTVEAKVSKIERFGAAKSDIVFVTSTSRSLDGQRNNKIPSRMVLHYEDASPQPFVPGTKVELGVDSSGKLLYAAFEIDVKYWRKRPDGRYELIAQVVSDKANTSQLIHLHPRLLGSVPRPSLPGEQDYEDHTYDSHMLIWTPQFGLVITHINVGAGGGDYETEKLGRSASGIPVENELGFRFKPGRDGWICVEQSGIRDEIPDQQYIEYDGGPVG